MSRGHNQNFLSGMMTDSPPASESASPTVSEAAAAAARIDESLQPARGCAPPLSAGAVAEYRKSELDSMQSKAVDLVGESTSVKEFIAFCCFAPFDAGTLHYDYVQYTDLGVTTTTLTDFEFKAENMKAWRNRLQGEALETVMPGVLKPLWIFLTSIQQAELTNTMTIIYNLKQQVDCPKGSSLGIELKPETVFLGALLNGTPKKIRDGISAVLERRVAVEVG
uniref:Uncharacterized protein n=1 Tax=Chromera velia CCMP2878 TaxID=1169474 RepID=A0A0G4F0I6_9ALVE|eukprot:Cvel_14486.t1-p1 / transcript=Cvel_14486.t1 / gene=Cvel_14486 / organism=Chromera_velia_CCMP2878 / gene_product=hypothetical protein / transcript_product=hypothetical protein / location=Cvel_scaffold1032:38182-39278(-) / protein_length=222 / sequence_SO=supercontig / SO=protein_coding / is_pseudo=false